MSFLTRFCSPELTKTIVHFLLEMAWLKPILVTATGQEKLHQRIWGMDFQNPLILSFDRQVTEKAFYTLDKAGFGSASVAPIFYPYLLNHPVSCHLKFEDGDDFQNIIEKSAPYTDLFMIDFSHLEGDLKTTLEGLCVLRRKALKQSNMARYLPAIIPHFSLKEDEATLNECLQACLQTPIDGILIGHEEISFDDLVRHCVEIRKVIGEEFPLLVKYQTKTVYEMMVLLSYGVKLIVTTCDFLPYDIKKEEEKLLAVIAYMEEKKINHVTEFCHHEEMKMVG